MDTEFYIEPKINFKTYSQTNNQTVESETGSGEYELEWRDLMVDQQTIKSASASNSADGDTVHARLLSHVFYHQ